MKNKIQKNMYTYHVKEMIFINACKKTSIKIGIYFAFVLVGLILVTIPYLTAIDNSIYHRRLTYPTDLKYILFWSQHKIRPSRGHFLTGKAQEFLPGQRMFIEQKCPHINCYITYEKDVLNHDEDYDAVVFDIDDIRRMNVDAFNLTRTPEQVYIFRSSESPEKYTICDRHFDNFFNWTWTYKLNSDIPQPFYSILDDKNSTVGPRRGMKWIEKMKRSNIFKNKMQHKNKAVAWIVTKCKLKTKHQDFINEFRSELRGYNYSLDLLGPCGVQKCQNIAKCHKIVEKNYYFQLVLEEYFSDDYVTENVVHAMMHFTIPIVIGAGDYRDFLPPGAYINAQSFDLKKLGALVDYLIKNVDMYEYFFDWRNHYYFKERPKSQVCDLCEKLNSKNKTMKSYKHFRHWWEPEYKDICQRIRLYKMFNAEVK